MIFFDIHCQLSKENGNTRNLLQRQSIFLFYFCLSIKVLSTHVSYETEIENNGKIELFIVYFEISII